MGSGLLSIPNPVTGSNVFVAAQGVDATVPSRTYPYNLPAGLEGLCRNMNLTSRMPVDTPTPSQLMHQATIQNDITGPGGDEVCHHVALLTVL